MSTELPEHEIEHAVSLLRDAQEDWGGFVCQLPCDPVCRFDAGDGPCDEPIETVTILSPPAHAEGEVVHALVNCQHHADVMKRAIDLWRSRS